MSSKGRGAESVPYDFYPTPPWCVDRLLEREPSLLDARYLLEPSVGDGAIVRAYREHAPVHDFRRKWWTGVELRRGALNLRYPLHEHDEGVDFRTWEPNDDNGCRGRFDLAIGNPPFTIAEGIIRHALDLSRVVCMLLRVGFLGSSERLDFWTGVGKGPVLRVLPERPSFDGRGTDSSTYAWFIWGAPGITGVEVLDSTPKAIRSEQKPDGLHVDPAQIGLFDDA